MALLPLLFVHHIAGFGAPSAPVPTVASPWRVTPDLAMEWNNELYTPVGVRLPGDSELVPFAVSKGVKDFILDLPMAQRSWMDAAQKLKGARFIASLNSAAPFAVGVTVQPQWYRVPGLTKPQNLSIPLPGADSALIILAVRRDGNQVSTQRVKVTNGVLNFSVKPVPGLEQVALIYPIGESTENDDLWERFDKHRDTLLRTLQTVKSTPGLRGILNPMGQMPKLPEKGLTFVSTSPLFRMELAAFLEEKYKSLNTFSVAWAISANDFESFEAAARLVPLWTNTRGMSRFYDPDSNRIYITDQKRSVAWKDIEQVVANTRRRRIQRLAETIRRVIDVPVIQQWNGWSPVYEMPYPPIDGLGIAVQDRNPSAIAENVGQSLSSLLRWKKSGWHVATDVAAPTRENVTGLLDSLSTIGVRGVFFRAQTRAEIEAVAGKTLEGPISRPEALYFPENARNPAFAQQLGGNTWWLPGPFDGNRINFGVGYNGYVTTQDGQTNYVLWTDGERRRVTLLIKNPNNARVLTHGGINPDPIITKAGLEITLSGTPVTLAGLTETPVPSIVLDTEIKRYYDLIARAASIRRDVSEEVAAGKDLKKSAKVTPSKTFDLVMRLNQSLYLALGSTSWIEAENVTTHNFSEVLAEPGCSGEGALSLRTPFATEGGVNTFKFVGALRTTDDVEVWVAARVQPADRGLVKVKFGSQIMTMPATGISPYGKGFAWYKFGTTRFLADRNQMQLDVQSREGVDLSIDAIVIAPVGFNPQGPMITNFYLPPLPPSAVKVKKP